MSDDRRHELPRYQVGELWPQVVRGYWSDPVAPARTIEDGWLETAASPISRTRASTISSIAPRT